MPLNYQRINKGDQNHYSGSTAISRNKVVSLKVEFRPSPCLWPAVFLEYVNGYKCQSQETTQIQRYAGGTCAPGSTLI